VIRWRLQEILKERNWTAYRLAQETGLTVPAAYQLSKDKPVQRIDAGTLEKFCEVFGLEPGDLLERVPAPARRRRA
jgi:DNA-binding Xre family transcriptional regulator